MLYRIIGEKSGYTVSVEDGDTVLVSVPAPTLAKAHALVKKAAAEGYEAIAKAKVK